MPHDWQCHEWPSHSTTVTFHCEKCGCYTRTHQSAPDPDPEMKIPTKTVKMTCEEIQVRNLHAS